MISCRATGVVSIVAALAGAAHADDVPGVPDQPHIVVTGEGSAQADPDYLELTLYVTLLREDGPAAKAAADERSLAIVEALRALGLKREQVTTNALTFDIEYDYDKEPSEPIGYEAGRTIDLTSIEIGMFDAIVDTATKAGATGISSPTVRSKREAELTQQAQARAVQDARQRAESLARGFGRALGAVYGIATGEARSWSAYGSRGGGSIFGDPEDEDTSTWISYTPQPVVMRQTVYAVFLLGPELPPGDQRDQQMRGSSSP